MKVSKLNENKKPTESTQAEAINVRDIENIKPTSWSKMISASSRFRPYETIVFEKPIVGVNGNKLISYEWSYEWTMVPNYEGELTAKRVSDWTQAESSAETGRDLVHKFKIERKDGTIVTVSSESVPVVLGYVDAKQMKKFPSLVNAVKTLAKQRMQLAILEAQLKEYNELYEKYEKAEKPKIEVAELKDIPELTRYLILKGSLDPSEFTHFKMGDVVIRQEGGSKVPNNGTKEQLIRSWINSQIEKDGGKYPDGIYDLRRRVERQEKKVSQIIGGKVNYKGELHNNPSTQTEPNTAARP